MKWLTSHASLTLPSPHHVEQRSIISLTDEITAVNGAIIRKGFRVFAGSTGRQIGWCERKRAAILIPCACGVADHAGGVAAARVEDDEGPGAAEPIPVVDVGRFVLGRVAPEHEVDVFACVGLDDEQILFMTPQQARGRKTYKVGAKVFEDPQITEESWKKVIHSFRLKTVE